jgi:hypothetical protein
LETKKETYPQLRARQQKETDEFPMFFAFSEEQFAEGMRRFGLFPGDTGEILKLGNSGGYILKTDSERLSVMFDRHGQELTEAMKDMDFAAGAFRYQLNNHEYCITHDRSDTLTALGLTDADLTKNKTLNEAFGKAEKQYWSDYGVWERGQSQPRANLLDKVRSNQIKVAAYKEANPPDKSKNRGKSGETLG